MYNFDDFTTVHCVQYNAEYLAADRCQLELTQLQTPIKEYHPCQPQLVPRSAYGCALNGNCPCILLGPIPGW